MEQTPRLSMMHETSPYLLQHAHNPLIGIWAKSISKKAKKSKLVIISMVMPYYLSLVSCNGKGEALKMWLLPNI
jgi:hypothetical protein